jgi:hypothetical protein
MPQAIKIVSQSQKQGLTALCKQAATGSTAGKFAFGHGEDGFNQRAATVFMTRKGGTHLRSDTMNPPRLFPAFGGDDAQSMKLPADKNVIALGVELGVGQDAAHGSKLMGLSHECREVRTIVPRGLTRRLRQDELLLEVDDASQCSTATSSTTKPRR